MQENLGRRIAELRLKLGWTQQETAVRVAISRVALSHLEAGMSIPGERTVVLLAGLFGMEPHELVAGTNYPAAKAERLPVVSTRYTEVQLQLELLRNDLCWVEQYGGGEEVATRWEVRLSTLLSVTNDERERVQLEAARQLITRLRHSRDSGGAGH